jgi:hypothetical protein
MPHRLIAGAMGAALLLVPALAAAQPRGQASGMVEDVKGAPNAGVDFMDFVNPGQQISLGQGGQIVISYFQSCRVETIRGGTVTIGTTESRVQGGTVNAATRACDAKKFAVTTRTAEAGAAAKRLGKDDVGSETSVKSDKPIFRWQQKGAASIRVFDVSTPQPQLVWSGSSEKGWVQYPASGAPKLKPGTPYTVEAALGAQKARADFLIDPELKLADTAMNRTVVLTPR